MNNTMCFDEVKSLWENKVIFPNEKYYVYIDNPFCIQKCEFCIHFGTATRIDSDIYNKYYREYLPKMIKDYSFILEKRIPESFYFGGGTASLMTNEIMESIFSSIPNFENAKERAFEAHPAFLNSDKIEIFKKYAFNYLSLGIQTLDKNVLSKNNRIPQKEKILPDLIQQAQESDIIVNCDLLAYIETGTIDDAKTLYNDLCELAEKYKPKSITIYPMYQRYKLYFDSTNIGKLSEEDKKHDCTLKRQIFRQVMKFIYRYSDYKVSPAEALKFKDDDSLINSVYTDIYLITVPEEEFSKVKIYNCSSYPSHSKFQNVLGLGGYGIRAPYSYFGKSLYYHARNVDWNTVYEIVEKKA